MNKALFLITLLIFTGLVCITGCFGPKSPDAVTQETSGGYRVTDDGEKTAVIIAGAYNNIEIGEIKNFRERIEWSDEKNNLYSMDFSDEGSPMYIKGRGNIIYIAVKVRPGSYKLNGFKLRAWDAAGFYNIDFGQRYSAAFSVAGGDVVFVGILRTLFDKFSFSKFNNPGSSDIKLAVYLENGKDDLYKIKNFYNLITSKEVKTSLMYWNDKYPGRTETVTAMVNGK
ncbi:MAG: hypothetical protein FWC57_06360 [Endomicrobia bacterium]|nr:hypothetical protein [Endomicrobiia bacterium]